MNTGLLIRICRIRPILWNSDQTEDSARTTKPWGCQACISSPAIEILHKNL